MGAGGIIKNKKNESLSTREKIGKTRRDEREGE